MLAAIYPWHCRRRPGFTRLLRSYPTKSSNVLESAWAAMGLYHFGIALFVFSGDRGRLLKHVGRGWHWGLAVAGVVMSALIVPIFLLFWGYMRLENATMNSVVTRFGLQGTLWFVFMIYFSTVQPLLEELYWRGYLGGSRSVFCWPDFAFAGYHILVLAWFIKWPWLLLAFVMLIGAAWVWRNMASRLEGLAVPLLSHVVADVSIITVVYFLMG